MSIFLKKIIRDCLEQDLNFQLEVPPGPQFGDFATNVALILASKLKQNPRELAQGLAKKLSQHPLIKKVEVAGPGFLNFFLEPQFYHNLLQEIEAAGADFGCSNFGQGKKILLEFISANPTGPLTIANGRGGFGGDVLARVLTRVGFQVVREFFVNDAGEQVRILGESILAQSGKLLAQEKHYQGAYIANLARNFPEKIVANSAEQTGQNFAEILLEQEIKPVLRKMGIQFDNFFSERKLHASTALAQTLAFLQKRNLTYEKTQALWLKTSRLGDDKDRVLVKSNGQPTYFLPDLAYHQQKFERGFERLILILGADHHGYVPRLKIGVKLLGYGEVEVVIAQLVKLFAGKQELKMSKRSGNFETLAELIAEIGADVCRWFFLERAWNTHLNFDLALAKKQSQENPVFYVQYAYTRLVAILQKAQERWPKLEFATANLNLLQEQIELELIKKMAELPALVELIAQNFEVHRLPLFARELAEILHRFYAHCRVLDSANLELTGARLRLITVARMTFQIILTKLIGVKAPKRM